MEQTQIPRRWRRWITWTAGASVLAALGASGGARAAPATSTEGAPSMGRYACLHTATRAELVVDLATGENGAWRSELTLTVHNRDIELHGAVYDVDKLSAKRQKPPQLRLKAKALDSDQRSELLQGLAAALNQPEEPLDCAVSAPQNVKLSWVCFQGETQTRGNMSFESARCLSISKGYTRAVGVADWVLTSLRRYGAR
jgi:hypothetical protein